MARAIRWPAWFLAGSRGGISFSLSIGSISFDCELARERFCAADHRWKNVNGYCPRCGAPAAREISALDRPRRVLAGARAGFVYIRRFPGRAARSVARRIRAKLLGGHL